MDALGIIPISQTQYSVAHTSAATANKSKLSNTVDDLTKIVGSATGLIQTIKGGNNSTPTYNPTVVTPPPPTPTSNNKKYILIAVGVLGVATVVYLTTRKKKK